jgi:small-conductance mechanosensitive channel
MEAPRLVQELDRFDVKLFTLGGTPITLWDVGFVVVGLIALFWFSGYLTRWLDRRLARHSHLEPTTRQTIDSLVRYTTLVIGFMIIMQAAGINLTTFNVVAGAIGVGVGFGLQNIVSNFVSGLIVMFERPVRLATASISAASRAAWWKSARARRQC